MYVQKKVNVQQQIKVEYNPRKVQHTRFVKNYTSGQTLGGAKNTTYTKVWRLQVMEKRKHTKTRVPLRNPSHNSRKFLIDRIPMR